LSFNAATGPACRTQDSLWSHRYVIEITNCSLFTVWLVARKQVDRGLQLTLDITGNTIFW
jgi:hypothetical protein